MYKFVNLVLISLQFSILDQDVFRIIEVNILKINFWRT